MPRDFLVSPVRGRRELGQFVRLPWQIYGDHSAWVPPLLFDLKTLLSVQKHPFHQHADVEYFLAHRDGRTVGRIAAIINHAHRDFHNESVGFFGFFECVDDEPLARALFSAAETWARGRGVRRLRGPMSFSTNEQCGLLVDGFETSPSIMMPHNHRYYVRLIENSGYKQTKDMYAYALDLEKISIPERLTKATNRLQAKQAIKIRNINKKRFEDEVRLLHSIYHSAWETNWGYVPMTHAEVDLLARTLRLVADPRLCLIAETDHKPVAFAIALPDYNQVLKRMNGRLFPFGVAKLLWHGRKINALRVLLLGAKPDARVRGVEAMLYTSLWEEALRLGYKFAECSWILEDNWAMRRGMERMNATIYKTYRVFEKPLGET